MARATSSSVTITWDPPTDPNGIISSYEAVLIDSSGQNVTRTVDGATTMATFSDLMPHLNYTVIVRPFTGEMIPGNAAEIIFVTEIGGKSYAFSTV